MQQDAGGHEHVKTVCITGENENKNSLGFLYSLSRSTLSKLNQKRNLLFSDRMRGSDDVARRELPDMTRLLCTWHAEQNMKHKKWTDNDIQLWRAIKYAANTVECKEAEVEFLKRASTNVGVETSL